MQREAKSMTPTLMKAVIVHRTCAEYRNENQTRNARWGAALNISPQKPASAAESRVFHVAPKN